MPLRRAHIIGSGPNGLAAAITLAQRGVEVTVWERNAEPGGACTTAELTLPGFHHDVGASVYPLGVASPFLKTLPLTHFGLRWIEPDAPLAHPLDDGPAMLLEHSLEATAAQFDSNDAHAWRALLASSVRDWPLLVADFMRPLLRVPSNPVAMAFFGMAAMLPASLLAATVFRRERARALFAGNAAHAVMPLNQPASSAAGLVLIAGAHTTGWPIAAGGAGALTAAMAAYLRSMGGEIRTSSPVASLHDLPPADAILFDTSAEAMDRIAGEELSASFRKRLRHFRQGPGIFKLDWALREPIPWRDPAVCRAATVHLGGSLAEISLSEHDAFYGRHNTRPFVLLVQPSLFDPSRAPEGRHTAWAYCHVPNGSDADLTEVIEAQVERFAPGFRDVVLARRRWNATALGERNPNLVGGDISGGAMTLPGLIARPTLRTYRTSNPKLYLCSFATPPGGGVHGMAGHNAALAVWQDHAS